MVLGVSWETVQTRNAHTSLHILMLPVPASKTLDDSRDTESWKELKADGRSW